MKTENHPQGRKTHEQFKRTLENKDDDELASRKAPQPDREQRQSEFPVSHRGMNQESDHNKHNHPEKGA